jgi:hypothetical protein
VSEDFTDRLRLQLREAALREEQRGGTARRVAGARSLVMPQLAFAPFAAAVAVGLTALFALWMVFSVRPEPAAPPAPRVIADVPLGAGFAGGATAGFGSLWLSDSGRGEILRVDPRTRHVTARLPIGAEATLAAASGSLWAVLHRPGDSSGPLLRIDPRTGRTIKRISIRTLNGTTYPNGADIVAGGGSVWVVAWPGVLQVDPTRNRVVRELRARGGYNVVSTVFHGGEIWLTTTDDRTTRFDVRTGRRLGTLPWRPDQTPTTLNIAKEGYRGNVLQRIGEDMIEVGPRWLQLRDPDTGRVVWHSLVGREIHMIAVDRRRILVDGRASDAPNDRLWTVDGRDGRVGAPVTVPEFGVVGMLPSGRDVWLLTSGGRVVVVRP